MVRIGAGVCRLGKGFEALNDEREGKVTLENWEQGRSIPNAQAALLGGQSDLVVLPQ